MNNKNIELIKEWEERLLKAKTQTQRDICFKNLKSLGADIPSNVEVKTQPAQQVAKIEVDELNGIKEEIQKITSYLKYHKDSELEAHLKELQDKVNSQDRYEVDNVPNERIRKYYSEEYNTEFTIDTQTGIAYLPNGNKYTPDEIGHLQKQDKTYNDLIFTAKQMFKGMRFLNGN